MHACSQDTGLPSSGPALVTNSGLAPRTLSGLTLRPSSGLAPLRATPARRDPARAQHDARPSSLEPLDDTTIDVRTHQADRDGDPTAGRPDRLENGDSHCPSGVA